MTNILTVGHFNVRLLNPGDKYGLNDCLTHAGEPLVEFYDTRFDHTQYGQFVSRYYLSTMLEHGKNGLCLDGGNRDEWSLSGAQMSDVIGWLVALVESAIVSRASESPEFKQRIIDTIA